MCANDNSIIYNHVAARLKDLITVSCIMNEKSRQNMYVITHVKFN